MSLINELRDLHRVYRNVSPRDFLALWKRRLCLPKQRLLESRGACDRPGDPRIVISLTTIPSRIGRIARVLNSLIDQQVPADEILLAVPRYSRRQKTEYLVPDFLTASDAVTLLDCDDHGPATKLLPALGREHDPATLLVAVDDDTIYPRDFIANLLTWHKRYPDAVLGYRGWTLPASLDYHATRTRVGTELDDALPVDVITGVWGLAVQPRFFDARVHDYSDFPPEAYFVDDIWFNGHLARQGVPRYLVPCRFPPMSSILTRVGGLVFGENRDGRNDQLVIQAFSSDWHRDVAA